MLANNGVIAEECFSNIRTVKSFGTERKEIAFYNHYNQKVYTIGKTKAYVDSGFFSITQLITYGIILVVCWYGGYLIVNDEITSGELTSFMLYAMFLSQSSNAISWGLNSLITAVGAAEKLFGYLDYEPTIKH